MLLAVFFCEWVTAGRTSRLVTMRSAHFKMTPAEKEKKAFVPGRCLGGAAGPHSATLQGLLLPARPSHTPSLAMHERVAPVFKQILNKCLT